jgi:hypothetical protein
MLHFPFLPLRLRLGRLVRTAAYSALLLALLCYGTYRLVFTHPVQIQRRLEARLQHFLYRGARVERPSFDYGEGLRAERLEFFPLPVLEAHLLGRLEDVRWRGTADWSQGRESARRRLQALLEGRESGGRLIEVRLAELHLDHRGDGQVDGWRRGWNFDELFRRDVIEAGLREHPIEVRIERARARLTELGRTSRLWSREIELADLLVRGDAGGLRMQARLPESAEWTDGELRLSGAPDGTCSLKLRIDDFRGASDWLPLLGGRLEELWRELRPEGAFRLEASAELAGSRAGGAGGGLAFDAVLEHYDTRFEVPFAGLELRHLRGPMRLTAAGVSLGEAASLAPASAVLWGSECQISGSLVAGGGRLVLRFPLLSLATVSAARCPQAVRTIIAWLRPEGQLEGELRLVPEGAQGAWECSLRLQAVTLLGLPALVVPKAELELEGGPEAGAGHLALGGVLWPGFGRLQGKVGVVWDGEGLVLKATDLKLSSEELPEEEPAAGRRRGSLWGQWRRRHIDGRGEAELRWSSVALRCALLQVREMDGTLRIRAKQDGEDAGAARAEGECWLRDVRVSAGIAGAEELRFETGRGAFELGPQGLDVRSAFFQSPGAALWVRGQARLDGEVDFLILALSGERLRSVPPLAAGDPRRWLDAAGPDLRSYRLSGTISDPRVRLIDATDPELQGR